MVSESLQWLTLSTNLRCLRKKHFSPDRQGRNYKAAMEGICTRTPNGHLKLLWLFIYSSATFCRFGCTLFFNMIACDYRRRSIFFTIDDLVERGSKAKQESLNFFILIQFQSCNIYLLYCTFTI